MSDLASLTDNPAGLITQCKHADKNRVNFILTSAPAAIASKSICLRMISFVFAANDNIRRFQTKLDFFKQYALVNDNELYINFNAILRQHAIRIG